MKYRWLDFEVIFPFVEFGSEAELKTKLRRMMLAAYPKLLNGPWNMKKLKDNVEE